MNADNEHTSDFEQRTRAVLEEGVARTDGHIRSRLTRARHAAVEAAVAPKKAAWRWHALMPATGAVAAACVLAIVLWGRGGERALPVEGAQATYEDLDLLADEEALNLMVEGDRAFYEWAVAQADAGEGAST
jgi:hypothetical protein